MSQQYKSLISFSFKGFVWKILENFEHKVLVLEIREEETRTVTFAAIDLQHKKILWQHKELQEKWWVGLLETLEDKILIHGYKDFQNPQHQKIFLLNLFTGKVLWQNEELIPMKLLKNFIVAVKSGEEDKKIILDVSNGKEVTKNIEEELGTSGKEKDSSIVNPILYFPDNKYFPKITAFISALTPLSSELPVEYLEHKDKIIVSFYFKKGEKLVNYLLVSNDEGEVLYFEPISEELSGIAQDSFFLWNDALIFIKNRKELVIFEL